MDKTQILLDCLTWVADETCIDSTLIVSADKSEDVVDARHLLVKALSDCGLYPATIAMLIGQSPRNINSILAGFASRCNRRKILRYNYAQVRRLIGDNYLTSF